MTMYKFIHSTSIAELEGKANVLASNGYRVMPHSFVFNEKQLYYTVIMEKSS